MILLLIFWGAFAYFKTFTSVFQFTRGHHKEVAEGRVTTTHPGRWVEQAT